ncbi:hypothetical protein CesoFtcFv8_014382 [Champsocephalus esox]|uniref:Uncharacterized protein n=1 Tax=Champsocephalus esox TaxID=159716 RepID=A0AAN8BSQ0_9TELE|nr:hypothetical protein CesoFtcFv8_014382 [Champsocephalus esox]
MNCRILLNPVSSLQVRGAEDPGCSERRAADGETQHHMQPGKAGQMDSRMSRDGSALIPNPTQSGEVLQKEECGS